MQNSQLWQQCENLTHHSLEAFLLSILDRPNIYHLYQFTRHPQINTVNPKVLQLFNLFVLGTCRTLPEQVKKELSKQKLNKLKKLSILSFFQGLNEVKLSAVSVAIEESKQETINILVQMSIRGVIEIKIDERKDSILIHFAQIRSRPFSPEDSLTLQAKISTIISKNKRVVGAIEDVNSEIKNKRQSKKVGKLW